MKLESLSESYCLLIESRKDFGSFLQGLSEYIKQVYADRKFRNIFKKKLKERDNDNQPTSPNHRYLTSWGPFELLLGFDFAIREFRNERYLYETQDLLKKTGLENSGARRMINALRQLNGLDGSISQETAREILDEKKLRDAVQTVHSQLLHLATKETQKKSQIKETSLMINDLKPEVSVENLSAYSDGSIRYKDNNIGMRNQLKDLCRIFLKNPKRLITPEDIKDNIISSQRRETTSNSTISKYVSELHTALKSQFKRRVIFSQHEEGWHFDPTRIEDR